MWLDSSWSSAPRFQKPLHWGIFYWVEGVAATGRLLPHGASLEGLGQVIGFIQVLREDSRCQPILGIIGSAHDLLYGLEFEDLHHWSKDLEGEGRQRKPEVTAPHLQG